MVFIKRPIDRCLLIGPTRHFDPSLASNQHQVTPHLTTEADLYNLSS